MGFGKTGFGEIGFGDTGRHLSNTVLMAVSLCITMIMRNVQIQLITELKPLGQLL